MKTYTTADKIYDRTMRKVAPLPCQENYARQLASILSFHVAKNILMDDGISVDDLPSMSALVVAPTGQGKTYLIRKMAEILDLNCIVIDCSTLSAEGWKGVSLSQRLIGIKDSMRDVDKFEQSILFLDEFDKLKLWGTRHDQGNAMVNILQMYNAGKVSAEGDGKKGVTIDVSRFTILLGGAFEGLDKIIEERVRPRAKIGFSDQKQQEKQTKADILKKVTHQDLIEFGIMPEILGRIGTILSIDPMEFEDYKQLLAASSGSVQKKYDNYLKNLFGVRFEITDAGTEAIARKCLESGTGARAVTPFVNDLMRDALSEVERTKQVNKVVLDAVENDCYIRYEYGKRLYCFHTEEQKPVFEKPKNEKTITVKAANVNGLTKRLCRYYANACDDEPADLVIIPYLETFLNCSLTYLGSGAVRKEDFCFKSLEKLARLTVRNSLGKATFEIMMKRYMAENQYFKEYLRTYNPDDAREVVECLDIIMQHLNHIRGATEIRFELKHRPIP